MYYRVTFDFKTRSDAGAETDKLCDTPWPLCNGGMKGSLIIHVANNDVVTEAPES